MKKHDKGKWKVTVAMEQSRQAPIFSMSNLGTVEVVSGCSPLPVNIAYLVSVPQGML